MIHKILITFLIALNAKASLEYISHKTFKAELEISGLLPMNNGLYAVSDNRYDVELYKVSDLPAKNEHSNEATHLRKMEGFWPYYLSALMWRQNGRWVKSPWDLEGGAVCPDAFYLVNEQVRHALQIKNNSLKKLDIDLASAFKAIGSSMLETDVNAGLEGIAVDCEGGVLYLAQERGPRAIFMFELSSGKFIKAIQTSEENVPHPDYADLFYDQGHLYALERNQLKILKISPLSSKVVDARSFDEISDRLKTKELYDTGKPFGLAEALYMDEGKIYLGLDNNGNSFSEKAKKTLGLKSKKNDSLLLIYKRPRGF